MPLEDTAFIIAVLTISGSIISASLSYYFTKKREIEVKQVEKKLSLYDGLLTKFTQWLNLKSQESLSEFLTEYHRASSYASDNVLQAIQNLLLSVKEGRKDEASVVEHERLINALFNAIRKDVSPNNQPFDFRVFSTFREPT